MCIRDRSISLRNTILLCVFLEDNARIVTTKSKCIGQGNINFAFLCFKMCIRDRSTTKKVTTTRTLTTTLISRSTKLRNVRESCKEELYKTAEDAIKNLATIPVLYNGGAIELNDYLNIHYICLLYTSFLVQES